MMISFIVKRTKFTLPDLPYDYNALEPVISAQLMQLHHGKHHATYVRNLNNALDALNRSLGANDAPTLPTLTQLVKFNAGGHVNHSLYWQNLRPPTAEPNEPQGSLAGAIKEQFGSFGRLRGMMEGMAGRVQGSGWAWMGVDEAGRLRVGVSANQDQAEGMKPILCLDVWEHAYYVQYLNARPDYLRAIWQCINWNDVGERYEKYIKVLK